MSAINQLSAAVEVSTSKCREIADLLRDVEIPNEEESRGVPVPIPRDLLADFYFVLVAICHQTSPIGKPRLEGVVRGLVLTGWDFLKARFAEAFVADARWNNANGWLTVRTSDIVAVFGRDISEPARRAELVRNLGAVLIRRGALSVTSALDECKVSRPSALRLLPWLSGFEAYSDPVMKKSVFLLSILVSECGWPLCDIDQLPPPVDYHEVRGHLRLGTVIIHDEDLRARIRSRIPVQPDEDIEIRRAVQAAITDIAVTHGGVTPSRLHYLFWNVFRSHCVRTAPLCLARGSSPLPLLYSHLSVGGGEVWQCPLSSACASFGQSQPLIEHLVETDYY